MQIRSKKRNFSRKSKIESKHGSEDVEILLKEIQALLAPHGVEAETVLTAFNDTLREIENNKTKNDREELRSIVLGTIVWKIFGRKSAPWISPKTKFGNEVPLDLMVTAHSMWRNAVNFAAQQHVDAAAAAEAFVEATHSTADRIVGGRNKSMEEVRNACNYMFAAFMHLIPRIAARQGLKQTQHVGVAESLAGWEFSDQGAFTESLESSVLCRELLNAMSPRARSVAITRFILGYSWKETAESFSTSINAVQKELSFGIRNAFGICMQELQKMGYQRTAEIESHLMEKNKKSRRRNSKDRHKRG